MRCNSTSHPQVPVTLLCVLARYCHACAAWHLTFDQWTQHGSEEPQREAGLAIDLGPFDGPADVIAWCTEAVAAALETPGSPWDSR